MAQTVYPRKVGCSFDEEMISTNRRSAWGAAAMRAACALTFIIFSFTYLYYYQASELALAQHVLSDGVTSYSRLPGAMLITAGLFVLQALIYAASRLSGRTHAVTYFPSFLILTVLTDISPDIDRHFSFGLWMLFVPLLLIGWLAVVWICRKYKPFETQEVGSGFFSRMMWQNLLTMLVMIVMCCGISCGSKAFHYRASVEVALNEGQIDRALEIGENSDVADSSLTMLRVYALSCKRELGEKLFQYQLVGDTQALLPNGGSVRAVLLSNKKILKQVKHDRDYPIIMALINCDLPRFADLLIKTYGKSGKYPKHYKEAFLLYDKTTVNPKYRFTSAVMEADYDDMMALLKTTNDIIQRRALLKENYHGTYWEYYYLHHIMKQ